MRRTFGQLGLLGSALVMLPALLGAQTTGTITGRVIDRASQQPLVAAQVVIVNSTQGTVTAEDGRYRIVNVSPGTHVVRALRIGFEAQTQTVTVTAGGTATADFSMVAAAVRLDEIVTTATGETQRKRESGNAIATVQAPEERLAMSTSVSDVLQAQAPGVYINQSGGTQGTASRIRIRGASSVSLTNEPLLLVDGVRASNEIGGTGTIGVGGQTTSRLNDINPDDIESIEVIKGPAAAALYGTAGANGVIQIRTKRGRPGKTRWSAYVDGGTQEDIFDYPANFTQVGTLGTAGTGARVTGCTIDAQARRVCTPKADSLVSWNPLEDASPFVHGSRSSYGLSASGGGEVVNYFISGDHDRDDGVYDPNSFRRTSLRANLTSQLRSNLNLQLSTSYISSRLEFPQNDNNTLGIIAGGLLGSAFDNATSRGYIAGQTPQDLFAIDTREDVERFISSATSNWQMTSWLTAVGTAGVDYFDRRNKSTTPPNKVLFGALPEGTRTSNAAQIWNYTANGNLTAGFDLRPTLRSTTSAGAQFTKELIQGTRATGAKLLAGTGSLQGTAARFQVGETNTDNKTLGAYVQQQLAWNDRLFFTAALRTDNNSAFGENFGFITYPAASLSYVISEEPFFPQTDLVNSLRLRTAYGRSGQRPNFRDAITFYNTQTVTVAGSDQPGITVGGTGNPDLKPELSTEYEVGFEAGLFNSRVGLEFGYYHKTSKDLLIARPLPPSLGLTQTQFANLGKSSNKGFELLLNASVVSTPNVKFDLTLAGSTNKNRLEDLGNLPSGDPIPPIVFGIQRHDVGYALGGYWDEPITYTDKNGDGTISRVNCPNQATVAGGPECEITVGASPVYLGNPLPTREYSITPRLQLFGWLGFSALVDHKGGFKQFNNTGRFRCNFGNCEEAYVTSSSLFLQGRNIGHLMGSDAGYVEDGTYTKLREVAMTLTAPKAWANRFRTEGLALTIAGRNLATWTDYTGFDPEVNSQPGANFGTSDFLTQPPLRMFSARLSVQF